MKGWWKLFLYAVAVFQQFNFRSIYLTLCNSPTLPYCVALPYLEINLLHLKALLTGFPIFKEKLITYFRPLQGIAYIFNPSCTSIFLPLRIFYENLGQNNKPLRFLRQVKLNIAFKRLWLLI